MSKEAFKTKKGTFFWFDPEELIVIKDPDHHLYDPRVDLPVNQDMVANILHNGQGILEPVLITKEAGEDTPIVVDGRQRTKNAREANRQLKSQGLTTLKVPCVYKRGNEKDLFDMMVSSNEQRKDDTDIEKAHKVQTLLNFGGTKKEAAIVFGVTQQTITNWLELLELDPDVQKDIQDGKTKPTAARKVAKSRMPKKEKRQAAQTASSKPRIRKVKEIQEKLDEIETGDASEPQIHIQRNVLRWVLNRTDIF